MRVLLVSDIHGNVENLEVILEKEEFDAILCAGDLSDANEFDDYQSKLKEVLEAFEVQGKLAKAVPGNMDPEEKCVEELIQRRMNLHKKIAAFEDFEAVGFGGGQTPFGTPFEPEGEEIKSTLNTLYSRMKHERRVAVIHQPPKDTELDVADGQHVGSPEVRKLIEDKDFELVVTGHIHESYGTDKIGDTQLINPGPVLEGRYGVAEFNDNNIEIELKSL